MKTLGIRHYSQIAKRAAERAKDRRPQYAKVVRVDGVRADLQIGQSLNIVKNVEVIGEPSQLSVGDTVQISWWSQDRPVALAGMSIGDTTQRLDEMATKLASIVTTRPISTPNPTGGISDWQILRFSGGALASVHDPTAAGLEDAMTVSSAGDMVMLPAMDLEANFTIPSGVTVTGMSRSTTLIRGTVTLLDRANLEKVRMLDTETADGEAVGAVSNGAANIRDCDIWVCNCGTGAANGAKVESGTLTITNSSVSGEAGAQPGYGVYISGGRAKIYETTVFGSTAQYNDDSQVFVHGTLQGEASCECAGGPAGAGVAEEYYMDGYMEFQTIQPHTANATLKDVAALERKNSYIPETNALNGTEFVSGMGATANNVYFAVNYAGKLVRLPVSGGAPTIITLDGVTQDEDGWDHNVFVKSDDEVYAIYPDGTNYDFRIVKYNITAGAHTDIATYPGEDVAFDGSTWTLNYIHGVTRCKYGSIDKLVINTGWGNSEYDHPYQDVIGVTVLNLLTDQVESHSFYHPGPKAWEPSYYGADSSAPVVYQDKVVFYIHVSDWQQNLANVSVCWFPVFIVNCTDNSVTIIDDLKRNISTDYWPWVYDNAGVDRDSGQFYFFAGDYDNSLNHAALIKVDLTTPPYNTTVERRYENTCTIIQGKTKPFGLHWQHSDRFIVRRIPDMTQIGIMDVGEANCVVDDEAGYIWEVTDTSIHGIPINGGEEKRIPLDFGGQKYNYPYQQWTGGLMIFDHKALVLVHSKNEVDDPTDPDPDYTVYIYQNEYIIMGPP